MGSSTAAMPASPARARLGTRSHGVAPEASPFGSGGSGPGDGSRPRVLPAHVRSRSRAGRGRALARRPPAATAAHTADHSTAASGAAPRWPERRRRAPATAQPETIGASRRAARPGPGCRPRGRGLDRCDHDGRDPPALRGDRVRRSWFPRCCWRPGLLSGEANLVPRRTPTGASSSSRGESALWTTSARPGPTRLERACARGHGPGRGAVSPGAGHGRGGLDVAPRRACARAARPRPGGGRRRGHRRDAV